MWARKTLIYHYRIRLRLRHHRHHHHRLPLWHSSRVSSSLVGWLHHFQCIFEWLYNHIIIIICECDAVLCAIFSVPSCDYSVPASSFIRLFRSFAHLFNRLLLLLLCLCICYHRSRLFHSKFTRKLNLWWSQKKREKKFGIWTFLVVVVVWTSKPFKRVDDKIKETHSKNDNNKNWWQFPLTAYTMYCDRVCVCVL